MEKRVVLTFFLLLATINLFSLCDSINHGTNLIWAQSPQFKTYTISRMVSIQGDPENWVANRKPQVTYISAPHFTWEFKALGFDWNDQILFWSESMNKKIQSIVLNGSADTKTLFAGTSTEVYGIAIDWLSHNLYFTDALYNWIIMTSSDASKSAYRIIVQDKLESPHGIAVHPQKGYLFWSDYGERPKIEIGDLLGQNRRPLVERDLARPTGLTIDFTKDSLYWIDTFKATVEVIKFNGQGRKIIQQEEGSVFYGVALFNDYLFVTEQSRGMLKVFNHEESLVSFTLGNVPYDIVMYDATQQPGNSTECDDLKCEHLCVLDPIKGAACLCGEGYKSEDERNVSCKPSMTFVHPSHMYAIRDSICHYPANIADMSLTNVTLDSQCFLEDRQGYLALTFDARENMLYYFANNTKIISRLSLEIGAKSKVLSGGTGVVNGMALDWVAGNLYWTDSSNGVIKVSKKSGIYQTVVLDNLTNPVGIVVHPGRSLIFWTDHGRQPNISARIEKAYMDGSGREIVMDDNIGEPNHLYIDFVQDFVYWTDSILHHVRRLEIATGRITVVFEQAMVKFYGLSFFKDYILWTDTEDLNGIHIARMDKKEKVRGIIHPRNGLAADLITFDIQDQPYFNNPCMESLSTCSHLCLMSEANVSKCVCGVGYELSLDGFTCSSSPVMDNFLLVNDGYQRQIFQLNLKTAVIEAVNLKPHNEPIALAYNPYDVKVFWSDNKANVIKEATIDGKYEKTVLLLNNASMCDGLAADYINKLLFFTDTGNDVIGVISMRNYQQYAYIITTSMDEPRDIVISPNLGIIYWSDWGTKPQIETANMDGSNRETLVSFESSAWPNGLALDLQANQLYWVDAHADKIQMINLGSRIITTLMEEPDAHYFSVDVIGEYLYVSDWKKNHLRRMNKKGGPLTQFGPPKFTRLYGIKGYNSSESFRGISICVKSVCEHLCLPRQNNQFSCRCSIGFVSQGSNCIKQEITDSPITLTTSAFISSPQSSYSETSVPTKESLALTTENVSTTTESVTTTTGGVTTTTGGVTTTTGGVATTTGGVATTTKGVTTTTGGVTTTTEEVRRSEQSTSSVTSTISTTRKLVTMAVSSERTQSSTQPWEMNTTIHLTWETSTANSSVTSSILKSTISPDNVTDRRNATAKKITGTDTSRSLSATAIGLIVACIAFLIVVAIILAVLFRRRYKYIFKHCKLIEDKNPADFYKIAFPGRDEDVVTFDTGIENPTYDYLHDTMNNTASDVDGATT